MLTEAERRNSIIPTNSPRSNTTCASEDIKNLIDTREPCSGNTALHWASKFGVRSSYKTLYIDLIFIVALAHIFKNVYTLCILKNTNLIHLLIGKHRANPNARSRGGYTPLMLAAIHQR